MPLTGRYWARAALKVRALCRIGSQGSCYLWHRVASALARCGQPLQEPEGARRNHGRDLQSASEGCTGLVGSASRSATAVEVSAMRHLGGFDTNAWPFEPPRSAGTKTLDEWELIFRMCSESSHPNRNFPPSPAPTICASSLTPSALRCAAQCCSMLSCVALCRNMLSCVVRAGALQPTELCGSALAAA